MIVVVKKAKGLTILMICLVVSCTSIKGNPLNSLNVYSECSKKEEICQSYNLIKESGGEKSYVIKDFPKSITVNQINKDLFLAKYSCGSPCNFHQFIGTENLIDGTDRFIAFDPKNNCLIEINEDGNGFTSKSLFDDKHTNIFASSNINISISSQETFRQMSSFDDQGSLTLGFLDKNQNKKFINFHKPCK